MGVWGWLDRQAWWVLWVYGLCLLAGTHWPNLEIIPPAENPGPLQHVIKLDKVWHVLGFGGLMVLLILAGLGGRRRSWAGRCGVAWLLGLGYAVLDEWTQGFMAGRTISGSDLVTNLIAMTGVTLLALLPKRWGAHRSPRGLRVVLVLLFPVLGVLALSAGLMDRLNKWLWNEGYRIGHLHPYDWIVHGVVSTGLSVALIAVWPMASRRPRRAALLLLVMLTLSAPALEVAQHYSGRGVEWQDVLSHEIGVLLAMMWWTARLLLSPRLREGGAGEEEIEREQEDEEEDEGSQEREVPAWSAP